MDRITVIPLVKIGSLSFGATRNAVRKALGLYSEFRKSPMSINSTDDFGFCHVYYDKDNRCEAFEFFPKCEIEIEGKVIFPGTIDKITEALGNFEEIDGCLINTEKSVGVSINNGKIESILFGKNDYYNWLIS